MLLFFLGRRRFGGDYVEKFVDLKRLAQTAEQTQAMTCRETFGRAENPDIDVADQYDRSLTFAVGEFVNDLDAVLAGQHQVYHDDAVLIA